MPKKRRQRNADATDLSTKTKRTKGKAKSKLNKTRWIHDDLLTLKIDIKVTHRSEEDSQEILNDGFQQLFKGKESIESMLFRKQSFKKCWSKVNDTINVRAITSWLEADPSALIDYFVGHESRSNSANLWFCGQRPWRWWKVNIRNSNSSTMH